jgi:hypothetical protein
VPSGSAQVVNLLGARNGGGLLRIAGAENGLSGVLWCPYAKRLSKMGNRGMPKIREAEQRPIRHTTHFPDGLYAGREQGILDANRELDLADRSVIRKRWCSLKLTHFPSPQPWRSSRYALLSRGAIESGSGSNGMKRPAPTGSGLTSTLGG